MSDVFLLPEGGVTGSFTRLLHIFTVLCGSLRYIGTAVFNPLMQPASVFQLCLTHANYQKGHAAPKATMQGIRAVMQGVP